MIKDAIANFARDRNLPSFSSPNRLQNIRNLRELAASGLNSIPLKKGLVIVHVNVLYHSVPKVASPRA